jgi:hypothetical protein
MSLMFAKTEIDSSAKAIIQVVGNLVRTRPAILLIRDRAGSHLLLSHTQMQSFDLMHAVLDEKTF